MSSEALSARRPPALGVDIGGGKIALGVVEDGGGAEKLEQYPTRAERGPQAIIGDLVQRIAGLRDRLDPPPDMLGVGICGQVSLGSGVVLRSPNLPDWEDVPLRERLERALGIRTVVANDVHVIALGEWSKAAGPGVDHLVVVFIGTGVGGGVVADGRLFRGQLGHAGEIGHTTIVVDGRACSCGNLGCLEAYAGGWAIAERAREAAAEDREAGAGLVERAGGLAEIRSETVAEAYADGDHLAARIVEETGHYLGAGMVGVVNSFNPQRLVLGGGVIGGIPVLLEMAESHIREHALRACTRELELVRASMGPEAGVVGGAALARQTFPDNGQEDDDG